MAQFTTAPIKNKIQYISTAINNEIVQWYIRNGYKSGLNEFRPGFINDEEYIYFIECFEILKHHQTDDIKEDQLLYNFIIYYYVLVIVEYYILDNSNRLKGFNNPYVQDWLYKFSLEQSDWASYIRRKLLHFNTEHFNSFFISKFNPYEYRFLNNKNKMID